jgi:hypothetical protein
MTVGAGNGCAFVLESAGVWNSTLQLPYEATFRNLRDVSAATNLAKLEFSGTQLKTVSTIDGPVSLESGTTVGLATDTHVAINAAFVGTSTPVYENVNMVSTPYSTFLGLQTYANELTTAAHLRADLWDSNYTGSQYVQVRPSATVSATGPSGLQLISLSTTVDNKVTNPANVRIIGGITGTVNVNVVNSTLSNVQISNGTTNANVIQVAPGGGSLTNLSPANGLVCNSVVYGYNNTDLTTTVITTRKDNNRCELEVRDNDAVAELTTIDNKIVQGYNTTNDSGVIGLNVMQIRPKVRVYNIMGNSGVADYNMMMMAPGGSRYYYNDDFGIANTKNWYAYSSTARTINYEYVDNTGAIGNYSVTLPVNTWTLMNKAGNVAGTFLVNKWTTTSINSPANVYISYLSSNFGGSAFGGNSGGNFHSQFTVPTGYVATISNVTFYSQISDYPAILKWDAQGNRSVVYYWITNTQFFTETYGGNPHSGVGGVFTAGETIAFFTAGNSASKQLCCTITCMPV